MDSTGIVRAPVLGAGARAAQIPAGAAGLEGTLAWPCRPSGFVLFAGAGGRGQVGLQNVRLAAQLRAAGIGTLLLDDRLGTTRSEGAHELELQAERLRAATVWLAEQPEAAGLALGYLGSGVGAAAALAAAATAPVPIEAVVSCSGRPDLLGGQLSAMRAPALLIVGSRDDEGLRLNRAALTRLAGPKRLVAITGAGPRFGEAGTLGEAGRWAAEWFVHYLAMQRRWHAARRSEASVQRASRTARSGGTS